MKKHGMKNLPYGKMSLNHKKGSLKMKTPKNLQGIVNLAITIAITAILIFVIITAAQHFLKKNDPQYPVVIFPDTDQDISKPVNKQNDYIIEDFFDPEEDYDLHQTEIDEIYKKADSRNSISA